MKRTLSIIVVIGLWLTALYTVKAAANGVYDGVWVGPLSMSFGEYNDKFNSGTVIYQDGANTMHQFDQNFGKIEMIKSGNQWIIPSPLVTNYDGINFVFSTFTLTFLSDDHFTSVLNFTADGIPGNGNIDAYKQSCPALTNGSTLTGLNGTMDSVKCYELNLTPGTTDLDVQTMGGTGDSDLYLIYHRPINEWVNYYSENFFNDEQIILSEPIDGKWYIALVGYEAYSSMSLKVTYQEMAAINKAMPWLMLLLNKQN